MENEDSSPYLSHILDPLRREIAVQYLRHELRKLFPSVREEDIWKKLDEEVFQWFGENPTLSPVRDFWNGLHGISMGFKLKNIVSWLTSANIKWESREIAVEELVFGTVLGEAKQICIDPLSALEARTWFFDPDHVAELAAARWAHDGYSKQTASRDSDLIFVVVRDGKFVVIDGNRRVLRAVLSGMSTVHAYIGTPIADPFIFESWVPTSTLIELTSFHRYWYSLGREVTGSVAGVLSELLRDSSAARFEFFHRCIRKEDEADKKLLELLKEFAPVE